MNNLLLLSTPFIVLGSYMLGKIRDKNIQFQMVSNFPPRYSFKSGTNLEETLSKIETLAKENAALKNNHVTVAWLCQSLNIEERIEAKEFYQKVLYPIMNSCSLYQIDVCKECIEKDHTILIQMLKEKVNPFAENEKINSYMMDTGTCSCCGKVNELINPFLYNTFQSLGYQFNLQGCENVGFPRLWQTRLKQGENK